MTIIGSNTLSLLYILSSDAIGLLSNSKGTNICLSLLYEYQACIIPYLHGTMLVLLINLCIGNLSRDKISCFLQSERIWSRAN